MIELINARLQATRDMRKATGKPRWKSRGFRYDLEDFLRPIFPNQMKPSLIPMSVEAADRYGDKPRGKYRDHRNASLRYEHSVPLGVLFELLMDHIDDFEAIQKVLDQNLQTVWITEDEDVLLNKSGYRSRMPEGWRPGEDVFARYRSVGIELTNESGQLD